MTAISTYTGCSAPIQPYREMTVTTLAGAPAVRVPLNAGVALTFTRPHEIKSLIVALLAAKDALEAARDAADLAVPEVAR